MTDAPAGAGPGQNPLRQRAEMLLDVGRPAEAIRLVERLVAEDPADAGALLLLAGAQLAAGRNMAADRAVRKALAVEPDNARARCVAALTADALGRADALDHAEAAVAIDPQLWFAHAVLGTVLAHAGRFDQAAEAAGQAVALAPEEATAHTMAGDVALAAGRLDAAEQAYQAALRMAPDHSQAQHNLGVARMRRSGATAGLRDVAAAATLDPELPEAAWNLTGYARGLVVRTGFAALLTGLVAVPAWLVVSAMGGGQNVARLLAGLLGTLVAGGLVGTLLRVPVPVRPAVRSALRARWYHRLGPASATIAVLALLAYAGTGLGVPLALLAAAAVGGLLTLWMVGRPLDDDR